MRRSIVMTSLLGAFMGCGGSDDTKSGINIRDGGASNYFDAGLTQSDGSNVGSPCELVLDPFPMPTQLSGFIDSLGESETSVSGGVDDDLFILAAIDGRGVFTAGLNTGQFEITGVEIDPAQCGLCVSVQGDVNSQTGSATIFYAAESGIVQINEISDQLGQTFSGSVENLSMREVEKQGNGDYLDVSGGCLISIDDFAFDVTLQTPPSN